MLPTMHYIVTDPKRRNRFATFVGIVAAIIIAAVMLATLPADDDAAVNQYLKDNNQLMEGK